jgi:uncharacterized membrane protein
MPDRSLYFILLIATVIWCAGIVAAPLLENHAAAYFYSAYSSICHQIPEHSFHLNGEPYAVCIRCTSIYFAFFIGVLLYPLIRLRIPGFVRMRYYIFILAVPMSIDVFFSWVTGYTSTALTRAITGGLFGIGASVLLIPLIFEALSRTKQISNSSSDTLT